MAKVSLKLPWGYSNVYRGGFDLTGDIFEQLKKVLGDVETISFRTRKLTTNVFEIVIDEKNVKASRGSNFNIESTVSGEVHDQLRLKYGHLLTIVCADIDGLNIEIVRNS
jgi:hypothetical protein